LTSFDRREECFTDEVLRFVYLGPLPVTRGYDSRSRLAPRGVSTTLLGSKTRVYGSQNLLATDQTRCTLPTLQIACGEVYREAMNREKGGALTEADLDKVGGLQGLFQRYLDNAIARVPHGQLLLCRAMLDALTTSEETKRAVTFEALLRNDDFRASPAEIQSVLDCLTDQKLVRPDLRGDQLFYELSHDRLAPSVVKWFKRDADFAQFRDARDLIADATRRASFPDKMSIILAYTVACTAGGNPSNASEYTM